MTWMKVLFLLSWAGSIACVFGNIIHYAQYREEHWIKWPAFVWIIANAYWASKF